MIFEPTSPLGQNVICFTTSIHGGFSKHNYFSLNIGQHVNDSSQHVAKNREVLNALFVAKAKALVADVNINTIRPIKWLNQQHSSAIAEYDDASDKPCDGIVTTLSNTPLTLMTADCMPVVMYCAKSGKLAAVHAGWRGLLNGIIEAGIDTFNDPKTVNIWIGPSISQTYFEISQDAFQHFDEFPTYVHESTVPNKWKINLKGIAEHILRQKGVSNIQISEQCSYQNKDCFSHRRAGHTGFTNTGRMATLIMRVD